MIFHPSFSVTRGLCVGRVLIDGDCCLGRFLESDGRISEKFLSGEKQDGLGPASR